MLADFREFYGLRISDVLDFDGSLPVWEAASLAKLLPPSSRTYAMIQGGMEFWGWTLDRQLWTSILDTLRTNAYILAQVNSKKKIKAPAPIPRPGDEERRKEENSNNPFAQMVKAQMTKLREGDEKSKIVISDD